MLKIFLTKQIDQVVIEEKQEEQSDIAEVANCRIHKTKAKQIGEKRQ